MLRDRLTAENGDDLDVHVLGVRAQRLGDLDAELARGRHHDRLELLRFRVEVLQKRQSERRRLARSGLRLADHVVPGEQLGDHLLLDRRRLLEAELVDGSLELLGEAELVKRGHRARELTRRGPAAICPGCRGRPASSCAARASDSGMDAPDHDLQSPASTAREQLPDRGARRARVAEQMHQPEADHRAAVAHQMAGPDLVLLARGDPERDHPAERGKCSKLRIERSAARHLQHGVDLVAFVGLQDRLLHVLRPGVQGHVGAEPLHELTFLGRRCETDHPRPEALGELNRQAPGASRRGFDHHRFAGLEASAAIHQRVRGQALEEQGGRLIVADLVGHRHQHGLGHGDLLGVATVHQQRRHSPAVRGPAGHLAAGDQRQLLLREVVVARDVRVGEVHPGPHDVDDDLALPGLRIRQVHVLHGLGPGELLELNRLHALILADRPSTRSGGNLSRSGN